MAKERNVYHVLFAQLLQERAPPNFEIQTEVNLTSEPQRADLLLIRHQAKKEGEARVLKHLWPRVKHEALVEFKSVARPLRSGDFIKLLGYGAQYHAKNIERLKHREQLKLVMIVAKLTPAFREESIRMDFRFEELEDGYFRLVGPLPYPSFAIDLKRVTRSNRDLLLKWFSQRKILDDETRRWLNVHTFQKKEIDMSQMEEYDELVEELMKNDPTVRRVAKNLLSVEERLEGVPDEKRLEGVPNEKRLEGIPPPELLEALLQNARSGELSVDELLDGLPEDIKEALKDRLH